MVGLNVRRDKTNIKVGNFYDPRRVRAEICGIAPISLWLSSSKQMLVNP